MSWWLIVALILLWCVGIATAGAVINRWHWVAQLLFYGVTGVIWIMPLRPLLLWMETGRWR